MGPPWGPPGAHPLSIFGRGKCVSWVWQLSQNQPKMALNRNKVCLPTPEDGLSRSPVSQPHTCKPRICPTDRWKGVGRGDQNQAVGQTGKSKSFGGRETRVQILPPLPPGSVILSKLHGRVFICEMGIIITVAVRKGGSRAWWPTAQPWSQSS